MNGNHWIPILSSAGTIEPFITANYVINTMIVSIENNIVIKKTHAKDVGIVDCRKKRELRISTGN